MIYLYVDAVHCIEDAWSTDKQFVDHELYGTPDYIAPEVILGQPYGILIIFVHNCPLCCLLNHVFLLKY